VALEYADAITDTHCDVDDQLFARLQQHYDDDTIAELTMIIAWENASSRFNRAFRIPSQGFWKRSRIRRRVSQFRRRVTEGFAWMSKDLRGWDYGPIDSTRW